MPSQAIERYATLEAELERREHAALRAVEANPPRWVGDALGSIPSGLAERRSWRAAARAIHAYRVEWRIPDQQTMLPPPPAYNFEAQRSYDALQRMLREFGGARVVEHQRAYEGIRDEGERATG